MDFHDKNIYNTEQVVFFRIHKIIFYLWFVTKKPTGLDGNLYDIPFYGLVRESCVAHSASSFGQVYTHLPSAIAFISWRIKTFQTSERGGGSEKLRIINTLAPGAKFCKPLVKRDLQAFNGYSFIIFTVSSKMHPTNEFYS